MPEPEIVTAATQTFGATAVVICSFLGGLLGLFGVAKILELYVAYRIKKKEVHDTVSNANEGKRIDQDSAAFATTSARLEKVEERLDQQNLLLLEATKIMAKQASDIEHITEDNKRLQAQLERSRAESKEQRDGMMKMIWETLTNQNELLKALAEKFLSTDFGGIEKPQTKH